MRAFLALCVCFALAGVQGARAASYVVTFQSGKMRPVQKGDGVKGARQITASWTIPSLPEPGKCSYYDDNLYMTAYSDGRNTLQTLLAKYQYKPNVGSYIKVCLKQNLSIAKYSAVVFDLVTNVSGKTYKEYLLRHGEVSDKYVSILSIATYKDAVETNYQESDGNGGVFTLTGTDGAMR
jgi:hypothetical protein